ncbi:tail fiber domain-containing protein [Hymenobacter sp. M29]|uniref:Tail fiber domain-containing protein n=1 Tax=Hymenobacter mellowenesis TaxID=3063995 RepID=A0ABT9ALE8_9BACT|nr:tail fiber domain-containing protein [Hymenobacter sp. M29]MDO7849817.1 tail fiber domain-containing protein [Hymenobacter sp. M29]
MLLGSINTTDSGPSNVVVSGTTAYVTTFGLLETYNVANPANPASPALLGTVVTGVKGTGLAVSGTTAYVVVDGSSKLRAYNVANPASPVLLGDAATDPSPSGLALSGTTAYVVGSSLQLFNVSNPGSPALLGTAPGVAGKIALAGTKAYVADGSTLRVFDVSNPASPVALGTVPLTGSASSLAASGSTAYVTTAGNNLLQVVTISATPPDRVVTVSPTGSLASVALPGAADFIQNQTAQPQNGGFSVSGAGTVGGLLTAGSASVNGSLGVNGSTTLNGSGYVGGNLGIGTANPNQKLDVAGNANVSGNANVGGSVGIGISSPSARLHVAGVALVNGGGPLPSTTNATGLGWNAIYAGSGESELYNYRGLGNGGFRFFSVPGTAAPTASNQIAQINGSTGIYSNLSDRRVKTNITPLAQGLRTVLALRPVSYDFHTSRHLENGVVTFLPDDKPVRALGFVAQELLPLVPEAVEKPADDKKGFYAVSYTTLVPVLTQAIQEQQAQIEALKQQNAALQARAATAEATASSAKAEAARATATLETFEARLRRLEAAGGQAQR